MPSITEQYQALVRSEDERRDLAVLGFPKEVAGIPAVPLTFRLYLIVFNTCPGLFLQSGQGLQWEDIARFYWVISPEFSRLLSHRENWSDWYWRLQEGRGKRRRLREIKDRDVEELASGLFIYLDDAFADSPASKGEGGQHHYSAAVSVVDLIASEYGWGQDEILDLPLELAFQFVVAISQRVTGHGIHIGRAEKFKGQWLKDHNAKQREAACPA